MEKRLIKIWNHQKLEGFYQSHSNKSDMVKYQTHIEISTKLIFPIAEKFLSFLRSITQLYSNTARQHCGTDTHSASGDKFKVSFNLLLTHYIVSFEWRKFVSTARCSSSRNSLRDITYSPTHPVHILVAVLPPALMVFLLVDL